MSKVVIGIFNDYTAAADAVDKLKVAQFEPAKISLLGRDTTGEMRPVVAEVTSHKADHLMTNLGIAGAIGGFLVGLTAIAIPGTGALLVAGPLISAISGAAAGSAIGVVTGALVHFDVPETEAMVYESHLTDGRVLIAVHVDSSTEKTKAEEVFDQTGAVEVDTKAAEASENDNESYQFTN